MKGTQWLNILSRKYGLPYILPLLLSFCFFLFSGCSQDKSPDVPVVYPELIRQTDHLVSGNGEVIYFVQIKDVEYNKKTGDLLVIDYLLKKLFILTPEFQVKAVVGRAGQGPGEFMEPVKVKTDAEGAIYVMDDVNKRIDKFDSTGKFLYSIYNKNAWILFRSGFSVGKDGEIYLYSRRPEGLIHVINQKGKEIGLFGERRKSEKRLEKWMNLIDMDIDDKGNLYVVFMEDPIIRKYDNNWQLVWEKDFSDIPTVKEFYNVQLEKREQALKDKKFNMHYYIILDFNVFNSCIYIGTYGKSKPMIHVFDSENGHLLRILRFNKIENEITGNNSASLIELGKFSFLKNNYLFVHSFDRQSLNILKF